MYGDTMEKSIGKGNIKSSNYFQNILDNLKNLNKTKIKLYILLVGTINSFAVLSQ